MTNTSKFLWPAAAVSIGLIVAITTRNHSDPSLVTPDRAVAGKDSSQTKMAVHQAMPGEAEASGTSISGTVLEVISVPNYTYLRIGEKGTPGTWAAVNAAEVNEGSKVTIRDAQLMENFKSSALKRTFEKIYFGALAGPDDAKAPSATGAPQDDVHRGVNMGNSQHTMAQDPSADMPNNPHAAGAGSAENPHLSPSSAGDAVPVGKVDKAKGENGKTVAEIFGQREKLVGKSLKLRATVVKVTANVMNQNFVHVRDGSGNKDNNDFDLTVTTKETLSVGKTVLLEGTLKKDVDLGSGYKYPVLLDSARLLSE